MDGLLTYPIPGPDETIIERKFICKTYALGKVLKHLGVTVTDMVGGGYFSEQSNAGDFIDTVMLFMYHSAAFASEKDGKTVDFTPADCYDWVDMDGGFGGSLYTQFSAIVFHNLGFKQVDEPVVKTEKKSQVKNSNGKKS